MQQQHEDMKVAEEAIERVKAEMDARGINEQESKRRAVQP